MASQMQQEINSTLREVDGAIRKFSSCLDKAKMDTTLEKTHHPFDELHALSNALRQHRDQVRKWMTNAGTHHVKKDKLADARQRIEYEMRRFQEFENALNSKTVPLAIAERAESESSTSTAEVHDSEVKVTVDQVLDDDGNNDLINEFTCKICLVHVVGCGPQLTRCSHLFCGDCMSQWFTMNPGNKTWAQRAKAGASVPCPVCKEPLQKDQDLNPVCADGEAGSRILFRMLSDTKIVCANNPKCNADGGCNWIGDYGSYQEHIRHCENVPLSDFPPTSTAQPPMALVNQADSLEVVAEAPLDSELARSESEHSICDVPEVEEEMLPADMAADSDVVEHQSQVECEDGSLCLDTQLTGLIGEFLEVEPNADADKVCAWLDIETDDTCSTGDSERFGSFEASDAESPVPSDKEIVAFSDGDLEETHACPPQTSMSPSGRALKRRQAKREAAEQAKLAQQAKFGEAARMQAVQQQWQAAQYQAAHYQMAQWQMVQIQAARIQAARMAHGGQHAAAYAAHAAHAARASQMQALQAMHAMQLQRARAAQQ